MQKNNFSELREGVRQVVTAFDSRYWQEVDEARAFPEKFVTALTEAGWLAGLIPEAYGGSGLSLTEAKDLIDMYDSPRDTVPQLKKFMVVLAEHRRQLESQLADLEATLDEVKTHEKEARNLLSRVEKPSSKKVAA